MTDSSKMTRIELSDEIIEALSKGKTVELSTSEMGPSGRNGTLTLAPDIGKFSTRDGAANPYLVLPDEIYEEEIPERYR